MKKGFTLVELIICVAIAGIILTILGGVVFDNRGTTEKRARQSAEQFVKENNIKAKRISCAGDSDADGYGSCTVTTLDDVKIMLQCPCSWVNINVWGATSCKEVNLQFKVN